MGQNDHPEVEWRRSWKAKPKQLKNEIYALYLASKHPRTSWYAKSFALLLVGYALSPIDLSRIS